MIVIYEKEELLWAKKTSDGSMKWLPLMVHMSDTVEVAKKLWNCWLSEGLKISIAKNVHFENVIALEEKIDLSKMLFLFIAAVHDIGKATPLFQAKANASMNDELGVSLINNIKLKGLEIPVYSSYKSSRITHHALMSQVILEKMGVNSNITCIIGSHHGKPQSDGNLGENDLNTYDESYYANVEGKFGWDNVHKYFLKYAMDISGVKAIKELPIPNMPAQVILTGLVIMADWIASNEKLFPYIVLENNFEKLHNSKIRIKKAWDELDLPLAWEASNDWMNTDLFKKHFEFNANELQNEAKKIAGDISEAGIVIIEAPMGMGKTEAALVLAEILANKFSRTGVFFALPTQATSNSIFNRIQKWMRSLDESEEHSLRLAHGKAEFNEDYQALKLFSGGANVYEDEDCEQGGAVVHEWFDGNKKAMLADFVVGTIDQLLLAALKQKHVMLRHLGLANKIVIIDECHAYDAYMNKYLEMALKWLSAYNVPVILLSATLPANKRKDLINSYLGKRLAKDSVVKTSDDPLGKSKVKSSMVGAARSWIDNKAYPKITYSDRTSGGDKFKILQSSGFYTRTGKTILLKPLSDDLITEKIKEILKSNACIGIVVNTVKKAQKLTLLLKREFESEGVRVDLFHSQFLATERYKKEEKLVKELGKKTSELSKRPEKYIVVGTQVLEQSLDIDFDIMFSDLSPIDLLLQRIGRLHRHERERETSVLIPTCYILGLDDSNNGSEVIYGKYLLEKTKAVLPEKITLPDDIPALIENVYDMNFEPFISSDINEAYKTEKENWTKKILKQEEKATAFRVSQPDFSSLGSIENWLNTDVSSARGEAAVRDGNNTIEVLVIIKNKKGEFSFLPWSRNGEIIDSRSCPSDDVAKCLAKERLNLPYLFCNECNIDKTIANLELQNIKYLSEWQKSSWLKGELFLVLNEENSTSLLGYRVEYDRDLGLLYEKEEDVE